MADAAPPKAATEAPPPKDAAAKTKPQAVAPTHKLKAFLAALSLRERFIARITALVVSLVFIDLLVIRPISNFLSHLDEMIRVEEEVIPKKLQILKYKDNILREYNVLKPFLTDPKLSQEEETARLLREIERVSKEVSLFVSNINPVKVDKKSDDVYFLSVDIEGKGGINQIRQFMKMFEASNPPIRIAGFDLKPQSKESEELKYSFTIVKMGVKEKSLPDIKT